MMRSGGFLSAIVTSAVLAGGLFATGAGAATLTFDNQAIAPIVESGYSYINDSTYNPGGVISLHDDAGGQQSATFAKAKGGYFDALSVDMTGIQRAYKAGSAAALGTVPFYKWAQSQTLSFDNFQWNGYRNGSLVASSSGSSLGWYSFKSYSFSTAYRGLSSLELVLKGPGFSHSVILGAFESPSPDMVYCDTWCAGVAIDNLLLSDSVMSAVPLPGGLLLLASALGLGTIVSRRRRK